MTSEGSDAMQQLLATLGHFEGRVGRLVDFVPVSTLIPYIACEQQPDDCAQLVEQGRGFYTLADILPRSVTYCLLLSLLRFVLTWLFFRPLAIYCLRLRFPEYKRVPAIDSSVLCRDIGGPKKPTPEAVAKFCKTHWKDAGGDGEGEGKQALLFTEAEVVQYLRVHGRTVGNERRIVKFIEALWRFIFYSAFVALGVHVLLYPGSGGPEGADPGPVSWVVEPINFWVGWPLQHVPNALMLLYYQAEIGAYLHQLLWTEVTRSDAVEMLLHHFVTLALLLGSYMTNFTRIGSYILLLHDAADIFLELGKVVNYTAKAWGNTSLASLCDGFFAVFAVTFFVTRLVLFPRHVLYQIFVHCVDMLGPFPGLPFFKVFLCTLQALHVFWFYLIARMVVIMFATGKMDDIRSDDEGEGEGESEEGVTAKGQGRGAGGAGGKPPAGGTPKKIASKKNR